MGKRNLYYLMARNRENNEIVNVSFKNKINSKLENIDIYTSSFLSSKQLALELYIEGFINDSNVDLFIANVKGNEVFYQEVLYANKATIQRLANSSLSNKIDTDLSKSVIAGFCNKMNNNREFDYYVKYNKTNLYRKFIDYFLDGKKLSVTDIMYRDGGWVVNNYHTLRNIYSTYDMFNEYSLDDSYKELLIERNSVKNQIIEKCEPETKYYDGSLFDFSYVKK